MRSAFLDDASSDAVSHAVRDVLERRGALISEHRHSRVRFHGLKSDALSWSRAGYVGIYQAIGEREVEVRLSLRARWPWRLLWTVCIVNIALLVLAVALSAPGTTWSLFAIFGGLGLIVAGVNYIGTLKRVRAEEAALMDEFEAAFGKLPDVDVTTDEERELAELEADLEGEIVRRKIEASRPPRVKGSRFSLRPAKKGEPVESPEERRDALLRRKADLEAKKKEREEQESEAERQARGRWQ